MNIYARVEFMPAILKIVFVFGTVFPLMTLIAVLTGTVLPKGSIIHDYGAAESLTQLMSVTALSSLTFFLSIFILAKRKFTIYIFSFVYFLAFSSPLILPSVQERIFYALSLMISIPPIVIFINIFLVCSKTVSRYFDTKTDVDEM